MTSPTSANPLRPITLLTGVYLAIVAILLILSIILAAQAGLISLIRTALVAMLFPSIILLPINLLLRRWQIAALTALPIIGLVAVYAPLFIPRSQPAIEGIPVLKVLTLNLHQPADPASLNELADAILEIDADIVAVQELGPNSRETFGPLLEDLYPYQALYADENYGGSGQGILSKYPIVDEEYWKAGGPWNGNLRVEIEIEDQSITIYNIHPHPPIERGLDPQMDSHANVIREVVNRAEQDDGPVLLMGDFNMTMQFEPYRWITASHTDAYRAVGEVGFGFTHPHGIGFLPPFWRIDYIFYNDQFRGLNARTLSPLDHTDHLPFVVQLQIVEP
jgi:endonuclease/exonuclease/phosphatase (EEP) superfamily protein YafD